MSFWFSKNETGNDSPKGWGSWGDDSKDSDRKWSFGGEDKEKARDADRDHHESWGSHSKFKNEGMAGANLSQIDWSQCELTPFKKEFYNEQPNVKSRSQKDVDEFRAQHQISIKSSYCPKPVFTFAETGFPSYISNQLEKRYKSPTAIQSQGWPAALSGNDVIGIAQTGSGKTLSFLLPGFVHINAQPPLKSGDGPIVLVLAPTRELAMQIQEECVKFERDAKITSACIFGGADKFGQKRELSRGNQIVVATPGRLLDFLESNVINLKRVTYLVLDEGDRMLDMGFEPQIRRIISQIRPDRQTLFWSATWPREVQQLSLEFCREKPVHMVVGNDDLAVPSTITQNIEVIDRYTKKDKVCKVLQDIGRSKVLIFCQTKRGTDEIANMLSSNGITALAIHGDKTQGQRESIIRQFKSGTCYVLVATDLAARGLDIHDIQCVINYDFPAQIENYVHRVGRTGRAGRTGVSFTFFTEEDHRHASKLIDILDETEQNVPDELYRIARRPIPANERHRPRPQTSSFDNSHPKSPEKPYSFDTYNDNEPSSPQIINERIERRTNFERMESPVISEKVTPPPFVHSPVPENHFEAYENINIQKEEPKPQKVVPTEEPYMYDGFRGAQMNPYANSFNGYQQLKVPSEAYHLNTVSYFQGMGSFLTSKP